MAEPTAPPEKKDPPVVDPPVTPPETPPADGGDKDEKTIPYTRFQEINEKKKAAEAELAKLRSEQEEATRKAAEEQGEFKTLYEKAKAEKDLAISNFIQSQLEASLQKEIAKNVSIVDADQRELNIQGIAKMVDRSGLTFADGKVDGVKEAIETVKASYPQMFEDGKGPADPKSVQSKRPVVGQPGATGSSVWDIPGDKFMESFDKWKDSLPK